jgi:outer membrane protein assembly factor BamB
MVALRHSLTTLAALSLASIAAATGPQGSDWPRLRGPSGTGVSPETGWSAIGRSEPLWSKSLGVGHSSFAVAGSNVYAMGYDKAREVDVVYCLEAQSGKELWTHTYPAEIWDVGHEGGTCTTPALEGDTLFTTNREGKVFSLNAETGSEEWSRNLAEDHDLTPPRWGFCASPLLVDDTLVINFGHIAGLDRATGETRWITEETYGSAYSTPIEFDYLGIPAVLALNGTGLAVIDRTDGSEITFHSWSRDPERAVYGATPIIWDGKIFLSSAYNNGCVLLEPSSDGLEVVWENREMRTSHAGCVLFEDHIYGFDRAILKCIDLDGNPKWRERGIGLGAMSIVGGRLLVVGAKGEVIVAEANPEKYVELSREKVMDGGAYWSTPVLSHGLVYARNSLGDMVCLDHRGGDTALAAEQPGSQTELPDAAALLTGHVEAIGGADALRQLTSIHFTGRGEQHGNGPIDLCDAELAWSEGGTSVLRFSTGFELGLNPEICWTVSTIRGGRLLEQSSHDNLKEALDLHRMLAPDWGYEKLQTTEARVFDDRMCYVVNATRTDGVERKLYIEVDSGLLAGQEGEDTSLWIFADYQDADGVLLPMAWSFYPSSSGVMTRASFSSVSRKAEPSALEPAKLIQLMTASDEQKASEDERLRAAYPRLVGDYSLVSGEMKGAQAAIVIAEGGLQFSLGDGPGAYIDEPDAAGRMYDLANRGQWVQLERDESGSLTPVQYFMYNEDFGRMESIDND